MSLLKLRLVIAVAGGSCTKQTTSLTSQK